MIVAEHDGDSVIPITYNALAAAKEIGGDVAALLVGPDCSKVHACSECLFTVNKYIHVLQVAKELGQAEGVSKLLVAQHDAYKGFLPESITPLLQETQKQFNFTHIIAGASAFGKVCVCVCVCMQANIIYCPLPMHAHINRVCYLG